MLERLEPRLLLAAGVDVVVIDSRLAAPDHLAGSVVEGAAVLLYDGAGDTAAAVLSRLKSLTESSGDGLASVSILSHGTGGQFGFGNGLVSLQTLAAETSVWMELGSILRDGANLYLFACNVLRNGGGGQILIDRLADLTGADVFASDDTTGAGGDWVLEGASSGDEAERAAGLSPPLDMGRLTAYESNLADSFTDVTAAAGLAGISNSYGIAWGDYSGDGYPDLYVSGDNDLYRNDGDGTFSAGPALTGNGRGTHWGDYDNDGNLDFAATVDLYLSRNNGDDTFTLQDNAAIGITSISNLGDVAWLDYDHDGDLDLWVPNGSSPYAYLYENDGDGTFTAIDGDTIGLSADTNGESTIVADYDGDGYTDILYRSDSVYLWHNNGDGTFTNTTAAAGISLTGDAGGYNGTAFGDYDGDGDLDLYGGQTGANKLYRNNNDGTFTDVTAPAGVAGPSSTTRGVAWGDYDHDGDLDLYVAHSNNANNLFRNNGDGTFTDVAAGYGMDDASASYGVVWADYDLDGDLDLYVGNGGGAGKLFRNNRNDTHFLKVKATGSGADGSPVDGTGSRVELWDAAGTTRLAVREVFGSEGYGSHSPRIQHFGIDPVWGDETSTFTVKVVFTGGVTITYSGVVPQDCSIMIGGTTLDQTIEVDDLNETPDIDDATFAVDEDAANGTDVGTPLAVTDPDAGDTTAWTITAGNGDGVFAIDADTGQITVTDNTTLDFETTPQYVLTVRVTDSGGQWDEAAVTVNVGDVNETPDINDVTFAVDEDAANGTDVGTPLAVTDPDAGDTTAWAITAGNGDGVFAIDPGTGQITVTDNTTLDFETTPQYVLTVRVTDSGGLWDEADVTVDVGDVNETPTVNDQAFAVDENSAIGTAIGTVAASDPDAGDSLTYAITAGNTGNAFAINGTTGEITVNNVAALDFETNPTFALTVEVTDTGALSDSATVTVNVTDLNEAPEVDAQIFIVSENAADGAVLGAVVASDPDPGDTLAYAVTGGTGVGIFAVDPVSGEITVQDASSLDYESGTTSYTLQVEVSDDGAPNLSDTATITIAVNDVAEGTGGGGVPGSSSAGAARAPAIARPASSLPSISMPTLGARIPLGPTAGRAAGEASSSVADAEPAADEPADGVAVAEPSPDGRAPASQDRQPDLRPAPPRNEPADTAATPQLARDAGTTSPAPTQRDAAGHPAADEPVAVVDSKPGDQDRTDKSQSAPPRVADARPASDEPDDAGATTRGPATDPAAASWHDLNTTMSQVEDLAAEPSGYPRLAAGTACGLSAAAAAACAVWCAKGAFFTRAALSCMPLWRWVDPMPVLQARKGRAARRSKRKKA